MTSIRVRPRFKQLVKLPPDELQAHLEERLSAPDAICVKGNSAPGFIVIQIPHQEQHFWSPQLSLELEEDEEEGGTIVRGLYGPNPTIWALFTFGYATVGILALFTAIISFSTISLGKESPFVWLLPFYALAGLGLYFVSQFGQKLGAEQTFQIHHFFEEAIGDRVRIHLF